MKASRRVPAVLDVIQELASTWWIPVACVCLAAAAYSLWARTTRVPLRAVATLQVSGSLASEPDVARKIGDAILRRGFSDDHPAVPELTALAGEDGAGLVADMRTRLAVTGTGTADVFEVAYEDEDAQRAADVANALAALVALEGVQPALQENVAAIADESPRSARLRRTLEARQRRFDALSAKFAGGTSPDPADLLALERDREALKVLESSLAAARSKLGAANRPSAERAGDEPLEGVALLRKLEADFREAAARVPRDERAIQSARRELEALLVEHVPGRPEPGASPRAAQAGAVRRAAERSERAADERAALEKETKSLVALCSEKRGDIAARTARTDEARRRQKDLEAAARERDRALLAYERARPAVRLAAPVSNIAVVRRAEPPASPGGDRGRLRVALTGLLAAAFVVLAARTHRRMRIVVSEAGLRAISPIPVLVSIPEIPQLVPPGTRRRRFIENLSGSALSVALLIVVVVLSRNIGH
jgi:hypothetical protein